MYRRIMLACSLWLAWSVPSSAKYRSAVNWASINRPWEIFSFMSDSWFRLSLCRSNI
jgi:hypothetical protein